ncbi:MAG: sodium:alanine symporter family protein [Gemmatimonadetes bacterium]|nr:sodium:alanine symporter family protein [Gemmatimonadota bacterium]MCY3676077.1 sodium:alanine symporter family protein [Gemmatimonadota bacterium]MYA42263.1 sodium:alanine symporter family protein [Gemmatimonadota bacterium]MYJ08980.1 sodium:alanine symporter family protein [Gemmatimonadota bacterium]
MDFIQRITDLLTTYVVEIGIPVGGENVPLMVIILLGIGMYLTLRLGVLQVRRLGHGIAVASGKYDDPDDEGDVTHFQALTTALSATVGIGNIAGVALAIHWGGPGALFWMWVTAALGMATKYSEVTLAQKYRVHEDEGEWAGTVSGGPMYYIERGLGPNWKWMAIFFAVLLGITAFLTGNGVQANTVADNLETQFNIPTWISGLVTSGVVAAVILGGISRIGRVTSVLAPVMAVVYVVGALIVIIMNIGEVAPTFALIFREAFNPTAGVAGTGVGAFLVTLMYGVRRGLFSNEAGQGSAPIAHSAAKTEEPVSEGVVALLEPFIDTIIICTMTGLLIIMTGVWHDRFETEITLSGGDLSYRAVQVDGGYVDMNPDASIRIDGGEHAATGPDDPQISWHEVPVPVLYVDEAQTQPFSGVIDPGSGTATGDDGQTYTSLHGMAVESGAPLTMAAFRRGLAPLGDWGHYIVVLSVLLFGISTAIAWSYYGDRCANYLFGARALIPYKVVFVIMHFVGAVLPLSVIWAIGDVFLAIVIWPNLIALGLLAPKVVEMTRDYFERKPWEAK